MLCLLFACASWAAASDEADVVDSKVEDAATTFMESGRTVGLSIGVHMDGRDRTYHFGSTAPGKQVLPSDSTQYCIGSITKTFTGTLLAQAVTENKVRLEDDVRKYLPGEYPNLEFEQQPIRLWQLANHTSGLPFGLPENTPLLNGGDENALERFAQEAAIVKKYTADNFLRDLHGVKLTRTPGVSFSYSNAAAQLLGLVLERVYGMKYEELMRDRIAAPLGMKSTKVTLSPHELDRFPKGYIANQPFLPPISDLLPAHGSIKSTTSDMLKYLAWHLAEQDEAVQLTHQPAGTTVWSGDNSYTVGLNWQIMPSQSRRKIFQGGNVPGHQSLCVFYPESDLGIVALSNEIVGKEPVDLAGLVDRILAEIDRPGP